MTIKTFFINVGAGEAGTRLDKFLAKRFPDHSRNYFQQLIKKGKISVNENPADKDASLKAGDFIFGKFEPVGEISIAPDDSVKFKVIRDAKEFAVVEKPAGLVTHPSATKKGGFSTTANFFATRITLNFTEPSGALKTSPNGPNLPKVK